MVGRTQGGETEGHGGGEGHGAHRGQEGQQGHEQGKGQGQEQGPQAGVRTQEFWDERYRSKPALWSGKPNPLLVATARDLPAGHALDAGCGEGADAAWLASHGWRVTAVDLSPVALERAAAHAETLGTAVASRIEWLARDLLAWEPPVRTYSLVSAQFVQLPREPRDVLFGRLAEAVAPGGVLLVVAHHPSDLDSGAPRPPLPEVYFTAQDVAARLAPHQWDVREAAAVPRDAAAADGRSVRVHDTLLMAVRKE